MINPDNLNIIGSVLTTVTASGVDASAASDLLLPIGKTIAELLYDQEKNTESIPIIIQEDQAD
jgi:hypothetical protein